MILKRYMTYYVLNYHHDVFTIMCDVVILSLLLISQYDISKGLITHSYPDSHTTGPGFKTGRVRCTVYRASD